MAVEQTDAAMPKAAKAPTTAAARWRRRAAGCQVDLVGHALDGDPGRTGRPTWPPARWPAAPDTASATVTYRPWRDSGRARITSSVPRSRSPAMAAVVVPTAKMPRKASASGCWKPSVMAPGRVNRLPEPKLSSCSGMAPGVGQIAKRVGEADVDGRDQQRPSRSPRSTSATSAGSGSSEWSGAAAGRSLAHLLRRLVLGVELQERLFQAGRLDGQVDAASARRRRGRTGPPRPAGWRGAGRHPP